MPRTDRARRRAKRNDVKLTAPQERYLAEIRAAWPNPKRYNGRARRPLEALRAAGLVTYEYELVPHIGAWTELFTVRLV